MDTDYVKKKIKTQTMEFDNFGKYYIRVIIQARCYIMKLLIVMIILSSFGGVFSMATEPNEDTTQKTFGSFLKKLSENKITRIELYYMSVNDLTRFTIKEDFLRDNHYDYKVIVMNPNLSELGKSLKEFKYEKVEGRSIDFRWGCVFYAENEEVLRLFFPRAPMVAVNGVGYKANPLLIRSLMQFLPIEAYNEMNEAIVKDWALSWQINSK